jgi:RND family efflux transporter MFP subunit
MLRRLPLLAVVLLAACGPAVAPREEGVLPVEAMIVERAPFQPTLLLTGVTAPAATAEMVAPASGLITYPPRFPAGLITGATVVKGEWLATIDSLERRRELALARVAASSAAAELARMERAHALGVSPEVAVARARNDFEVAKARRASAEREATALVVRATAPGRLVVAAPVPPGSEVRAQQTLARIAAAGPLRIEALAAASDLGRLQPGLRIRLFAPGTTTEVGGGELRAVAPLVDASGTVAVVAEGTGDRLPAAGEGIDLEVMLAPHARAITVPEEAVVVTDAGSAVFVLQGGGTQLHARRRVVRTGDRSAGRIEILDGLAPGDRIAVSGVASLRHDAAVSVVAPASAGGGGVH